MSDRSSLVLRLPIIYRVTAQDQDTSSLFLCLGPGIWCSDPKFLSPQGDSFISCCSLLSSLCSDPTSFPALRRSSHLLVQSVVCRASQVELVVKNPPANAGDIRDTGSILGLGRFPWKRAQQPTPVLLPGDSHRQEPGSLQSIGSVRVRHHWSDLAHKQDGHYAIYLPYTISFIQYHCAFPTDRKLKPKAWNVHS